MSTKTLLTIAIGFAVGVIFNTFYSFSFNLLLVISSLIFFIFFVSLLFYQNKKIIFLIMLFSLFFCLGYVRMNIVHQNDVSKSLKINMNEPIVIIGFVSTDPDEREKNTNFVLRVNSKNKTKILISTQPYTKFVYGDVVKVSGILQKPKNFKTDTEREFDYVNYLGKDGIYSQILSANVEIIDHGKGNFIVRNLFMLKNKFLEKIHHIFSEPEGSLLDGLLLGKKQSLGTSLKQNFIDTGLIHIVVLSGFNMTIVGYFFKWMFSRFNRRLRNGLAISAIVMFAIMVGLGATVVRAGIMAIFAILASESGNEYNAGRALMIAGILMVLHNPNILTFDVSFQLSFLATLGMVYVLPHMKRLLSFVPTFGNMREIIGATLSAQIFVLPFLVWSIGNLSIIAPITNILILPIVPYIMGFGFLTIIISFFVFPLALLFSFLTFFMLHYVILIVTFFASLSFSAVSIPQFNFLFVIVIYAVLFLSLWYANKRVCKISNI